MAKELQAMRSERDGARAEADWSSWQERPTTGGAKKAQAQIVHLSATVDAREREIERLRAQLDETVQREERRAARDEEIYGLIRRQVAQGKRAAAALTASRSLKAVDVVRVKNK
eukprot:4092382-Pyramimonas_sp.AAC.1